MGVMLHKFSQPGQKNLVIHPSVSNKSLALFSVNGKGRGAEYIFL